MPAGYVDEPLVVAKGKGFVDEPYVDEPLTSGPITPGNIDLRAQPVVRNPDGSISTVDSRSYEIDGHEVLLPRVTPDGRHLSKDADVLAEYQKTGRHLGIFPDVASANAYAEQLHQDYAAGKYVKQIPVVDSTTLVKPNGPLRTAAPEPNAAAMRAAARADRPSLVTPTPILERVLEQPFEGARDLFDAATDYPIVENIAKSSADLKKGTIPTPSAATQAATSKMIEGGFKLLTPLLIAGGVTEPVKTVAALVASYGAQKATEALSERAGLTPEATRLLGNLAAAVGVYAVPAVRAAAGETVNAAKKTGGAFVLSTKLSGSGYGPGDVPGARMTPYADASPAQPATSELLGRLKQEITQFERHQAETAAPKAPAPVEVAPSPAEPPPGPAVAVTPPSQAAAPSSAPVAPADAEAVPTERAPIQPEAAHVDEPLTEAEQAQVAPTPEKHDYSSTQVNLPAPVAAKVTALAAQIPDAAIAKDGRETEPHITVKYGLHTNDAEKVREVLADEPPITVTLGKTSFFPNGESGSGDVLKVDVDSPDLHRLNEKIADALDHTDTHPTYQPHVTIAYLKPGKGKKYAGNGALAGETITLDSIAFSGKDGRVTHIPLDGAPNGLTLKAPANPSDRYMRNTDGPDMKPKPGERFDVDGYARRFYHLGEHEATLKELAEKKKLSKADVQAKAAAEHGLTQAPREAAYQHLLDSHFAQYVDKFKDTPLYRLSDADLDRLDQGAEAVARLEGRVRALRAFEDDDALLNRIKAEQQRRYEVEHEQTPHYFAPTMPPASGVFEHDGKVYSVNGGISWSKGNQSELTAARIVPLAEYTGDVKPYPESEYMARLTAATASHWQRGGMFEAAFAKSGVPPTPTQRQAIIDDAEHHLESDRIRGTAEGMIVTRHGEPYVTTGEHITIESTREPGEPLKKNRKNTDVGPIVLERRPARPWNTHEYEWAMEYGAFNQVGMDKEPDDPLPRPPDQYWIKRHNDEELHALLDAFDDYPGELTESQHEFVKQVRRELARRSGQQEMPFDEATAPTSTLTPAVGSAAEPIRIDDRGLDGKGEWTVVSISPDGSEVGIQQRGAKSPVKTVSAEKFRQMQSARGHKPAAEPKPVTPQLPPPASVKLPGAKKPAKAIPATDPLLLAQAEAAINAATVHLDNKKRQEMPEARKQHAIRVLKNESVGPTQDPAAWHVEAVKMSKRGGVPVVNVSVRTYDKKTGKAQADAAQVYTFEVPREFTLPQSASEPVEKPEVAGEANPESTYAGDKLADLVPTVEKEQGERLHSIRVMQAAVDKGERGFTGARGEVAKKEIERLTVEYEATYSELADAAGQDVADEVRGRVNEGAPIDEPSLGPTLEQVKRLYPNIKQPPHPYFDLKNEKGTSKFPPGHPPAFYDPFIQHFDERAQTALAQGHRMEKKPINGSLEEGQKAAAQWSKLAKDWLEASRVATMRKQRAMQTPSIEAPAEKVSPESERLLKIYKVLRGLTGPADYSIGPIKFRKMVAERADIPLAEITDHIDELNDATEADINQRFIDVGKPNTRDFKETLAWAQHFEKIIPRAHRSLEKTKLQQFSTPLPIAAATVEAAQLRDGDHVLEPTAGTGNLLAPIPKVSTITVTANELSPRRADLLREQGYEVLQGDYLKGTYQKPTVIITNPPWGKYSTGKYGKGVAMGFGPTDVAERFVAKNLRDLADGGRLVAVMPTTMHDATSFKSWLREFYTVRAVIQAPPGAYDTRATSVDSVLLVVDKVPPATPASGVGKTPFPKTLVTKDWEAYREAVEAIPERSTASTPGARRTPDVAESSPEPQPGGSARAERPKPGPVSPKPRRDVAVGTERPAVVVAERAPESVIQPAREPAPKLSGPSDDARRKAAASSSFAPYPRRTDLRGQPHPKLVVEARQLAGVPYPALTYQPSQAIKDALKGGRVSVEQAEQALAAVQANVQGHHGYLAADAVGVGKSREIALTILEAMEAAKREGRELRLIVTTKNADNVADLIDKELYYVATGRTREGFDLMNPALEADVPSPPPFDITVVTDRPGAKKFGEEDFEPLPVHEHGIYVIDSYNLAAYREALTQVGAHGIVGDEAHRFKNVEGAAVGASWQGLHARIMRDVPRDQQFFAYFTATPAQSVEDYAYLYGLRFWPVDGFNAWLELVTGGMDEEKAKELADATERGAIDMVRVTGETDAVVGGDGETPGDKGDKKKKSKWGGGGQDVFTARLTPTEAEQIPREWKMLGRFSARDLWRDGTEFAIHTAALKDVHIAKYNQFVTLAQDIIETAHKYGLFDKSGKASRFGVTGQLQFAAKRIQMQPALEEAIQLAKQYAAEGFQPVISVINVSEMDPEKGNISSAIDKINTRMTDNDPDDPDGGLVDLGEIPEAIIDQARLRDQARDLGTFDDPIRMMEDAFGKNNIAFVIGGAGASRQVAVAEFQSGKRRYAFLSSAGSTGISLDHRVFTEGGQRGRRVFIDVQYEWSATEAIQRYGRVDRASSITPPKIVALTFGNASEKKFLATIANRMASLGALSKGGAESTGGAAALEEFEITGDDALQAARDAYESLDDAQRTNFARVKSTFRDPNRETRPDRRDFNPFQPKRTASGATMKDFQLPLLFMPLADANAFWEKFVARRDEIREAAGHARETRTARFKGEVLAQHALKPNLTLYEVKNEEGHKFGILAGLVTQELPKLRPVLGSGEYDPDTNRYENGLTRRYITFSAGATVVSGLQVKWTKVKGIAEAYGQTSDSMKFDTPEQVMEALKAGAKVSLQEKNPDSGKRWTLRYRPHDERIAIDNARMADRAILQRYGATYAPVGNYWHVVDLGKFLERFPAYTGGPETPPKPSSGGGSSSSMQSAVVPGLKEFVEQDVVPGTKAAAEQFVAAGADVKTLFSPQAASTPARDFAHLTRTHLAVRDQRSERARRVTRGFADAFDRALRGARTDEQKAAVLLRFTDAVEGGRVAELPESERAAAVVFRQLLDDRRKEIQRLGRLQSYIENYFPHEWTQPNETKNAVLRLFGKRPLQGPKSFLKQRTIPTTREGIEAGLVPISYNPVELVLRKLVEMDKFIAATRILKDGMAQGLAAYVPVGAEGPEGWQRFDGSFATVYGKPVVQVKEAYDPVVRDGLLTLLKNLRVHHTRSATIGGRRWGYAEGDSIIVSKFAGPDGVLMHELGHILDERYGLRQAMVKHKEFKVELRNLADLRVENDQTTDYFKRYIRKGEEKIANLVHAFLYMPDRAKKVAPNSYWFLHKVIKANPELRPLFDIQKAKSVKLGVGSTEIPVGGAVIKGYYYGPPEVVRLLHNHLAPGLRSSTAFNLYRRVGNFLNSVQLGLSAFHMTMTGLESVISKQSLAFELLARGEAREALKTQLQVPVAPLRDLVVGHKALRQFYEHDANARTIDALLDSVVQGGGGFGWSLFEHEGAPAKLMQALRQGNYPGAALRAIPALIEVQAKPIMEGWVPRLKMAAFLDLMRMELRSLGDEPQLEEVRRLAADAWDSIDNRFGQLRYDNLFWHTALKDLGMASVRALGWNVGSVREAFGAPGAQLRQVGVLPGGGHGGTGGGGKRPVRMIDAGIGPDGEVQYVAAKEPWLHRKIAWLMSTVLIYGLIGATYEYLHTGHGPKELKDYFFPHDANGQRVSIPGYFKDWYEFASHPVRTVENKMNPLLSLLGQIWNNEDYFGTEIVNFDDDRLTQLTDLVDYLEKEVQPLSLRSFGQRQTEQVAGRPSVNAVESLFGVNRAPGAVTETAAERVLRRYNPPQGHTKAQAEKAAQARAIRQGIAKGTPEGRAQMADAVRSGQLSGGQVAAAVRGARLTRMQAGARSLTLDQVLHLYDVATPEERGELRGLLMNKGLSLGRVAPADREAIRARFQTALKLPFTRKSGAAAAGVQ